MKRIIRSVIIFWGIVSLFPLFYLLYTAFESNFLPHADASVSIMTWLDIDADGFHEEGEPHLASICVGYLYSANTLPDYYQSNSCQFQDYKVTDETGGWGNACQVRVAVMRFMFMPFILTGTNQRQIWQWRARIRNLEIGFSYFWSRWAERFGWRNKQDRKTHTIKQRLL